MYVYSYVVCLAVFLVFLVGTNLIARAPDHEQLRVRRRVNRIDAVVQLSTIAGFVLVGAVGWFT